MANPAFRAATTARNGNVTCIISSPSTTVVGDVLTAVFSGYSAGTYSPTPTLPSGWTLLNSEAQTGAGYTVIDYTARFVATAAGAVSFTFGSSLPTSASGTNAAIIACYNQDTTTPIDDSQAAVVPNGTTATSPAATATVANDLILCIYVDGGNTGAIPSLPSGLTSALAYNDSTNGFGLRVGYTTLTASGTTPTYTSTYGETVDPASGVFGTMFTVLIKGAGGTTYTQSVPGSITPTGSLQENSILLKALSGSISILGGLAKQAQKVLSGTITASGALATSGGSGWVVVQVYQTTQKWHIGSYTPATLSITCNQGDSLIVFSNQWQSNAPGPFLATISPGALTTIYDPEASYNGTAEPVYAQALAAFNLNAGTYTITPPPLGGPGGDGDTYVLRVSGVSGLRTYGHANEGGGSTTTGNYTSSTATLQSAAVAGDLLCAIGGTDNNTVTTTLTVATPTGWTNSAKQTDGTNSPPSSVDYTTAAGGVQSAAYTWPDYASPVGQSIILALIPATGSIFTKALSGTITAAGAFVKQTQHRLSGAITAAGALTKRTALSLTASIAIAGAVLKRTATSRSGSITPAGSLTANFTLTKVLSGAIHVTGGLAKSTLKALSGSMQIAGHLVKETRKNLGATIAVAGTVTTSTVLYLTLNGSLTLLGALTATKQAIVIGALRLLAIMGIGQ